MTSMFNPASDRLVEAAEALKIAAAQSDLGLAFSKVQEVRGLLDGVEGELRKAKARLLGHPENCHDCWLGHH